MGCDIHTYVEQKREDGTWEHVPWPDADPQKYIEGPFDWRSYHMFGFLADVRNYSEVPPLAEPRGLPEDVSPGLHGQADDSDYHSLSWLSAAELAEFDYSQEFEDRRVTRGNDGGVTAAPGGGQRVTFREFLGDAFARDVAALAEMDRSRPTRVVFWFDS